jgi:hypothetical protein
VQGLFRVLLIAAVLPGCRQLFGIDDTVVAVADAAVGPDGTTAAWKPPTRVDYRPTDPSDDDPSLTADLLELYFNSSRGGNADIWVMYRFSADGAWGMPTRVVELSGPGSEGTPEVSPDGLSIIWSSDRPGGLGSSDIWSAVRPARGMAWTNIAVVPELSTPQADTAGCIPPGIAMVSRFASAQWDIYLGIDRGNGELAVELAPGLSTVLSERAGCISQDALTVYMDTDYNDLGDLYEASRPRVTESFAQATPITALNSPDIDDDVWISPSGTHAYFHSTREGGDALWESTR